MKAVSVLAWVLITAIGAHADVSPVGTWKGGMQIDRSKLPKPKNDQERKGLEQAIAQMKKASFTIVIKADKTYSGEISGAGPKTVRTEGKWTQTGSTLKLQRTKFNGEAQKGTMPPQIVKISADGKTLTLEAAETGGLAKIILKKA